jgi:hypothetical protein
LVSERSFAVDTKLTTEGRFYDFYERNQHFHRSAYRGVHDSAPPLDAQDKTQSRSLWISKDVPILRIDHVSIKGMLPGVRPALHDGGVFDFKEMNHSTVHISRGL